MSITKTIGGDRLGSGKQMQTSMHNYNRSSHNLSRSWRSTMAPGTLVPFLVEPALNGDTFDIDLDAMARTIPTQGPLMGTFKLQMDVFLCPIRLYQGRLHNNPIDIGLNMDKVKLPVLSLHKAFSEKEDTYDKKLMSVKFANNSLMKYLGMSGIGAPQDNSQESIVRAIQAVPVLAYYDIFKNYYANKQEEKAYVISGNTIAPTAELESGNFVGIDMGGTVEEIEFTETINGLSCENTETTNLAGTFFVNGSNLEKNTINIELQDNKGTTIWEGELNEQNENLQDVNLTTNSISFKIKGFFRPNYALYVYLSDQPKSEKDIALIPFDLKNIDKAREIILEHAQDLTSVKIGDDSSVHDITFLPYSINAGQTTERVLYNTFKMNGLVVKTYQSDLFNAWVNTEWIESISGVAGVTTIDTTDGLNLDTLNLAQKVYNMLNRIAVSGGTYQDWQEAVYGVKAVRQTESPIYCGGMSSEIVFEEVISTAGTEEDKLGTLAGKGTLVGKKGGKLHIKVTEPSYIIGIVSITPRIDYTQGNKWHLTEIRSIDDFHKPALDGIGFQDLIEEQAAWWSTEIYDNGERVTRAIGKVPAWINYMTAYDEAYGDFAEEEGKNFMILARNYGREAGTNNTIDMTTYIEPEKFNYAFAYKELAAQNFWVQIYSHITARRIMSAKIIPNL